MYLWIKAFHLIFMVAWFAGLFYIFRLYVYHVKYKDQDNMCKAYEVMEKKLLYVIMHPAMLLTIVLGVIMLWMNPVTLSKPWFHIKALAVIALIAYQVFAGITRKKFAKGNFFLSEKACRIINEVPTILLIVIVILAIIKPS